MRRQRRQCAWRTAGRVICSGDQFGGVRPVAASGARLGRVDVPQALGPTFSQLGAPPQPNTADPAATRQAYIDYLAHASNADQLRTELSQLRTNLNDAVTQLKAANPNDAAAVGQAFGAVGNAVGLVSTLTSDPQLRAAIDQTPECHTASG
ncbi:MAG TPA: hypothetical protein VE673_08935 [Pseudonocardiaceae bacterium]|nr:hypothetical protein [Pseudonocardiaceae bacterium]